MVIFQLFSKNGIFIVNGKYFIIMARKYTNKEFLELLNSVRDDVEILEEYCGMDKRTLFKCKKCGYTCKTRTAPMKCPVCSHPQGYFFEECETY